jgi:hypothetical protein
MSITDSMKIQGSGGPIPKRTSDHLSPHEPRKLSTSSLCDTFTSLKNLPDASRIPKKSPPALYTPASQADPTARLQPYSARNSPKSPPESINPTNKVAPTSSAQLYAGINTPKYPKIFQTPTSRAQPYAASNPTNTPSDDKTSKYKAAHTSRAEISDQNGILDIPMTKSSTKKPPKTLDSRLRGKNKPLLGPMAPKDDPAQANAFSPGSKIPQTRKNPHNHQASSYNLIGPPNHPPVEPCYINELPPHIRPYIDQVINVKGDGHCGFRAAAYCMGQDEGKYLDIRAKVVKDLQEKRQYYNRQDPNLDVDETIKITNVTDPRPCTETHWMSMPSMGRPLANALQTAVFFYSNLWCESFFPDFAHPNNNPPVIFAFIPSARHFVAIKFKDTSLFPAPRPVGTHGRSFSGAHGAWQAKYSGCIALYKSLNP